MFLAPVPAPSRIGATWKWWLFVAVLLSRFMGVPLLEAIGPSALVVKDLDPKALPISFASDANDKDVSYKSRSVYKPATVTTGGAKKDVRLMMRAKQDGAALQAVMDQEIRTNDMDYRIRVAFDPDKTTGLVDGTSLGFFELQLLDAAPVESTNAVRRLEAVYDASMSGYTVRATDGSTPLGVEIDVTDPEVVLRLRLSAGTLFMEAGRPTGPFITDIDTTELYSESLTADEPVTHTFSWGVSALDKSARLYFNQLVLWGAQPDIGAAETPIAETLTSAVLIAGNTLYPADVAGATQSMEDTRALLASAVADLSAAVDESALGTTADGPRALENAQKALALSIKAKAAGEKMLAAGKTNTKPLGKRAKTIALRTVLALVQVGGFRGNSPGKVLKTVSFF